jgi:DNA-directed RNA polymerase specialized sigma24 family protein
MASVSMLAMEEAASQGTSVPHARLERVFAEQHDLVWRLLRRFGLAPAGAAEATRRVFVEASKELVGASRSEERSVLLRLTLQLFQRSEALQGLAGAAPGRNSPRRGPLNVSLEHVSLAQQASGTEALGLMDQVLSRMGRSPATAFILFELEGLPFEEIAEVMGVERDTAVQVLLRAREEFQQVAAELRKASRV